MSTPSSNNPNNLVRGKRDETTVSRSSVTDPEYPLNPSSSGPIRTWPRVHPSRGQIRSCIEFSPAGIAPHNTTGIAVGMSLPRRSRIVSQQQQQQATTSQNSSIRPNSQNIIYSNLEVAMSDGQNSTCRASRSSSIQEISGAHSLSSGGAGCAAGSSRRTSLSQINSNTSSRRNSMINPTFLDMHHLIGLNHLNFGAVDVDYGDEDNSLSQSHSVSSGASGGSGGMDHDSLEDLEGLHRQQDAEFQDILADFADQQHELEQRMPMNMPRTSHSQTSLSLSSVVSNEDTSESSCGTLSEIFESLSRFSEHCLASVEALSSPIYLNTSSFTTTPTGPGDNFEFQFDYIAPSHPQMDGGLGGGGARGVTTGVNNDGHNVYSGGDPSGKSELLAGINESHRRRSEFFQGMLEDGAIPSSSSSNKKEQQPHTIYSHPSEQSCSAAGRNMSSSISGNQIQNSSSVEGFSGGGGGGESSETALNRRRPSRGGTNILQDIGLELELFSAGLEFGNIIDLPSAAVPSTSRGLGAVVAASGEDSIVAALNVLRESAGPLVSGLDWQGRCMELELALQRFGEQANRARLMLRDKYVACVPFKWDPKTERVIYESSKIRRLICKFQVAVHLIYCIVQYLFMYNSPYDRTQQYIALVFSTLYSTALGLRFTWDLDPVPMELNNSLIDFETEFFRGMVYKKTLLNTIISGLIPLVLWTGIFVPVAFVLVLAKYPCAPPFLGSMLQSCRNGMEPGIGIQIVILLFEFLVFFPAVIASAYNLGFIFFPGIFCMWDYLRIIGEWKAKSDYEDEKQRLKRCIQAYKKLQILEILNTLSSRKRLIPTVVVCFPAIQFVTSFVCIKLSDQIAWPEFGMLPLVYFDSFVINIVMFTAASLIFEGSGKLLKEWKSIKKCPLHMTKALIALPQLKVKFGDNFVDRFTPLVIQDFCIQNTASALLLSQ